MLTKTNAVAFKLLALALIVTVASGCKPPGPRALLAGQRLLEKGRPDAAVARLEVATQLMSTNANAWNYLGIAYHQTGNASNAVIAYQRALTIDPDLVETRFNLGNLWLEVGRPAEAKSEFTAYNLRRPNAPEGFSKIALAELHLRETAAADQHIRKALQLDDANPDAWNTLGLIQLQQGKTRDAANSFGGALHHQPDFGPAMINLAVLLHQSLGDRAGALKLYRQYAELKPRPADADAVMAVIESLEKELRPLARAPVSNAKLAPEVNSIQETKKAAPPPEAPPTTRQPPPESKPPPTGSPANMATSNPSPRVAKPVPQPKPEPEPKRSPVVEASRPAVATSPGREVVEVPARPVETVSVPASNPPEASPPIARAVPTQRSEFKRGVTPLPPARNPVFVDSTPAAAERLNATDSTAGKSATGNRVEAERFAERGSKALLQRRYIDAAEAFRAAVKADPDWFQAQFNLAAAAIQAGLTVEALTASERALALKPDSLEARYNYALALKQAARFSEAAAQLDKVTTAHPGNVRAHLTLGNLYADQLRQPDKARLHYLKILEMEPGHAQAAAINFWLRENPAR